MMALIKSRLENIIKNKVMKNMKQLTSTKIQNIYSREGKLSTSLVTTFFT